MKNVTVTFSVPKSIYEWPVIAISILLVFKINFWGTFANVFVEENYLLPYLGRLATIFLQFV